MTDGNAQSREDLISEPIVPQPGTFDVGAMTTGEPGLPTQFTWRKTLYTVAQVLETWKESGPCPYSKTEMYLRKHWYRLRTTTGETMTLYFNRQPRRGKPGKTDRWILYSMRAHDTPAS